MPASHRKHWAPCLAIVLAIAAGCQPAPVQKAPSVDPVESLAASPTAAAQSPMPSVPTSGIASGTTAPETPLPSASADSNLDSTDQSAVEDELNSDEIAQYMPDNLIHDGGVILFQTLSLEADSSPDAALPSAPPQVWARENVERGGRLDKLRMSKDATTGDRLVNATLRYLMRGDFVYRPTQGRAVHKRFNEDFVRDFKLRLKNNRWTLDSFSPIQIASLPASTSLSIDSVSLFEGTAPTPLESLTSTDHWEVPGREPVLAPGGTARLEVRAHNLNGGAVFVFADLVGASDRNREQLYDDGTHGDLAANDGVYTAVFAVPTTPGLRHFAVDLIDPVSFTPGGLYRSAAWGLSFRVESPTP